MLLPRLVPLVSPQLARSVVAPVARPQITRVAATQRAAQPPEPEGEYFGVTFNKSGKHRSWVNVPSSEAHLLPESLRRPGSDGRVQLIGGTYSTAKEAASATDRWVQSGPMQGGSEACSGLLTFLRMHRLVP
jgi:hypothetical protein